MQLTFQYVGPTVLFRYFIIYRFLMHNLQGSASMSLALRKASVVCISNIYKMHQTHINGTVKADQKTSETTACQE